jgi:transmembrane sensor
LSNLWNGMNPVDAEAARWIERGDREDWSTADRAELDSWLAQSPVHAVSYLRLYDAWHRADRLAALRSANADAPAEPARGGWMLLMRVAAVLCIVAIAGFAAANYLLVPKDQTFSTPVGGRETVRLSDGSLVELNTNTALRIRASANARLVTLDRGEAYFQVKHDATHPFVVTASDGRVVDLGTKFVVRDGADHLEVALVEGRARFESTNPKTKSATLTPGDVVVATADSMSVTKRSVQELANALGWRRGVLVFDHTTLADAAAELNRYNREKIVIADPDVRRRIIGATIPLNGVEAFTRVAEKIFGVHVEKSGSEIIISR